MGDRPAKQNLTHENFALIPGASKPSDPGQGQPNYDISWTEDTGNCRQRQTSAETGLYVSGGYSKVCIDQVLPPQELGIVSFSFLIASVLTDIIDFGVHRPLPWPQVQRDNGQCCFQAI